jgi:hypothetical protein
VHGGRFGHSQSATTVPNDGAIIRKWMRIEPVCLFLDERFIGRRLGEKCIASEHDLRNKPIAPDRPRSAVIAISAMHSTVISSNTIIVTSNDRAPSRAF